VYAFRPEALPFLRDNPALMRVGVGGMPPVEAEIAQSLQMMVDEGETVAVIDAPASTSTLTSRGIFSKRMDG
jgi:hypothetical protein